MHYDVDIAVIGGGSAGLTAAAGSAMLGAKTVLIERDRLGGDCTWNGCVPSKALLHAAKQMHAARQLPELGISLSGEPEADFGRVMNRVREIRAGIYREADSPDVLKRYGVHPLNASAKFIDARTLLIQKDGQEREVRFRKAIIATGARPTIPNVPGLESVPYLTNETIFEIREQPEHLLILGGGSVGVELAQAFARLGTRVTVVCRSRSILAGEDAELVGQLRDILEAEGIQIQTDASARGVSLDGDSIKIEVATDSTNIEQITADALLVATGRHPNLESLDLEWAGVDYGPNGIPVDDFCRTNVSHIFAVGDVTTAPRFTHVGEDMAKKAALNALIPLPLFKREQRVVPRVTYTDPELAQLGSTRRELDRQGARYRTLRFPFSRIDRAIIEGRTEGEILIHADFKGSILGVSILGCQAGEMIDEFAVAMQHGIRLDQLSSTIHAYPTMLLGARRAADQHLFQTLQPWMVRGIKGLFGYRGKVPQLLGSDQSI